MEKKLKHPKSKEIQIKNKAMFETLKNAIKEGEEAFNIIATKALKTLNKFEEESLEEEGSLMMTEEDSIIVFGTMWDIEKEAEWLKDPTQTRDEWIKQELDEVQKWGLICKDYN
tara:strand:- start:14 stop:355 length:342 start_codon:yes stop_codon:yes gene_type:complete